MTRRSLSFLLLLLPAVALHGQHLIDYSSGVGSRDPQDANTWILYRGVRAAHEGMTLLADSALYNTAENSFTAYGSVVIELTDTTHIYGQRLFYDGNARVVTIWADTVRLDDGGTRLLANQLTYDRNAATAFYTLWGHGSSDDRRLDSRQGQYNSESKIFYIYDDVHLRDSSMELVTDTLVYNTVTKVAHFESPTRIYSDSSLIYSELGDYNTDTRYAVSRRASHVENQGRMIDCDTLFYDEREQYGIARGHVVIVDSVNNAVCSGRYGETNQARGFSFVTDSAHVLFVDGTDSLFLHADTIHVTTDTAGQLSAVRAYCHVKVFRRDAQAMCDSAYYSAADSLLSLFRNPVLWYGHYQCSADTIEVSHGREGVRLAYLRSGCFAIEQVDKSKFNQLKGRQGTVHFCDGEPLYADIEHNAQMVFYITERDSLGNKSLMGVNTGRGARIRIYFDSTRSPERVVVAQSPDMQTLPVADLPADLRRLPDFNWLTERRPRRPEDVFLW